MRRRKPARLKEFDYTTPGPYFVTVCARQRRQLFGELIEGQPVLSSVGDAARCCWLAIPSHCPGITIDAFVVMPDHVHGILFVADRSNAVGAGYIRPLPIVIALYKAAVSRSAGQPVWQRSYYERVIRNDEELRSFRQYIENNPLALPT